ncbi:hypothetical protein V2J09_021036 [Rumex salicifolius]
MISMQLYSALSTFTLFFLLFHLTLFSAEGTQEQDEPYVGVNIGTDVTNFLSPKNLVSFLQLQKINHVRLYDADPDILKALARTKIRVIIGVPNNQLIAIGSSNATAATWVTRNVVAYHPETLITAISVGDEVLTTIPTTAPLLLPAIQALYNALVASNLHNEIKVSTPHSASLILDPFPPSQAFFNTSMTQYLLPIIQFLSKTKSPLMMNLYPYYVFMENKGVVPLDNSLFKTLTPSKEMVDPNTLLHYTNVYDAMLDSAYFCMKNLNVTDVLVLVTETGWPSKGDSIEPYATIDNADTYNSNLIKHVFDRSGTPFRPEITPSVYIYELFNEDLRTSPVSEANWGLFYGNKTAAYLLHVSGSGTFLANDSTNQTYCIAMDGTDTKTLQTALDWACGPGRANCSEIQPGEACYQPNNVKSHASYAFDSYYQKQGRFSGSCDFKGVAMITTTDPKFYKSSGDVTFFDHQLNPNSSSPNLSIFVISTPFFLVAKFTASPCHGSCIFPGSKKISKSTKESFSSTQVSAAGSIRLPRISLNLCILVMCIIWFIPFGCAFKMRFIWNLL